MEKKSVYTLAEVATEFQESESKIRYYTKHFKLNVPVLGGKLAFTKKHIDKLRKLIEFTGEQKLTLKGAKANLRKVQVEQTFEEEIVSRLKNIQRILMLLKENV